MPLPEEKLYQYDSFCDYAKDNHLRGLFKPGDYYDNNSLLILKVDDDAITLIGDISMSGTLSVPFRYYHRARVAVALCSKFKGIYIHANDIQYNGKTWNVRKKTSKWWVYKNYQKWLQNQMPINVWMSESYASSKLLRVETVNFNVRTILKTNVRQSFVWEKLYLLHPKLWLSNIGVLKSNGETSEERLGLCSFWIPKFCPGVNNKWRTSTWWDVPNDVALIRKEIRIGDFVRSECAVNLPFVSLPFIIKSSKSRAMAFDEDDFLPNPLKRRELLYLVKKMDRNVLDAYFNHQNLNQYTWGPNNSFGNDSSISNRIMDWENRWLKLKAVTSHQPNSVLGHVLLEEDDVVIKFTLQYFSICAETLNQLKIGIYCAVESLVRAGRLSQVRSLISGRLKVSGKVLFHPQSFQRIWSAAFAAIEVNNLNSLLAAIAADEGGTQLHIRGERGITALGLAVMNDRAELVQVLLEASAKVDQPSWGDETALGLALQLGVSIEVISKLINAGAKVNGRDLTGHSIHSQLKSRSLFVG